MSEGYKYEESLTHGAFKGELSNFSANLAKERRNSGFQFSLSTSKYFSGRRWRKYTKFPRAVLNFLRYKVGYDWVILIILGVLMALLSAGVDYLIDSINIARLRIYDHAYQLNVFLSVSCVKAFIVPCFGIWINAN